MEADSQGGGRVDEASLIRSAQSGDKQAFSDLIRFYYPYVQKFLLGLSQDETVAEDLTQETFVRLIRGIERFEPDGAAKFSTYVMTIAKRLYLDHLRRTKHILLDLSGQPELCGPVNLEEQVLTRLAAREAFSLLSSLPEEQAQAIRLKYLEQMTLEEIAIRLGSSPKTVKSRIHNGIVKLRRQLT